MRIPPSVGYVYLIFIIGVVCLICEYEVLVVEQPPEGLVELVEPLLRWRQFASLASTTLCRVTPRPAAIWWRRALTLCTRATRTPW